MFAAAGDVVIVTVGGVTSSDTATSKNWFAGAPKTSVATTLNEWTPTSARVGSQRIRPVATSIVTPPGPALSAYVTA